MILEARRTQRLELARDLHDFVAHDVTGMVVQAQAARVIAHRDPDEALAALARIEESGQHALLALDRTVRMLGDLSTPPAERVEAACASRPPTDARTSGIHDVFDLVGRYSSIDRAPVHLHVDPIVDARVSREVSSTVYRVVAEALTNVRRHAASAARVDVSIAPTPSETGPALTVRVTNESLPGDPDVRRRMAPFEHRGGTGLVGLAERVEAVGGTFTAGPVAGAPNGWQVIAVFPLQNGQR